eukprot:364499-Chlamydomonas_euryale.AAC.3
MPAGSDRLPSIFRHPDVVPTLTTSRSSRVGDAAYFWRSGEGTQKSTPTDVEAGFGPLPPTLRLYQVGRGGGCERRKRVNE